MKRIIKDKNNYHSALIGQVDWLNYTLDNCRASGDKLGYCQALCDFDSELDVGDVYKVDNGPELAYFVKEDLSSVAQYDSLGNRIGSYPISIHAYDFILDDVFEEGTRYEYYNVTRQELARLFDK